MRLIFPNALISKRFSVATTNFNLSFHFVNFHRYKEYQTEFLYLNSISVSFYRNLTVATKIFNLASSVRYSLSFKPTDGRLYLSSQLNLNLSYLVSFSHLDLLSTPVTFSRYKDYYSYIFDLNSTVRLLCSRNISFGLHTFSIFCPRIAFSLNLIVYSGEFNLTSNVTLFKSKPLLVNTKTFYLSSYLLSKERLITNVYTFNLLTNPVVLRLRYHITTCQFNLNSNVTLFKAKPLLVNTRAFYLSSYLLSKERLITSVYTFNLLTNPVLLRLRYRITTYLFNLNSNIAFYKTNLLLANTKRFYLSGYLLFGKSMSTGIYAFNLFASEILFDLSYSIDKYIFHLSQAAFLLQKKEFVTLKRFFNLSLPEIAGFIKNYCIKIDSVPFILLSSTSLDINQAEKLDLFLIYPSVTLFTTKLFNIQKYLFTLRSNVTFGHFKEYQSYNFILFGSGINFLQSLIGDVSTVTFLVNSQVRLLKSLLIRPFYTFVLSSNVNLLITKAIKVQYTFVLSSNILLNRQIIYNISYTRPILSSAINFKYSRVEPLLYYGFRLSSSINASVGKSVRIILSFNITSSAILEFNRKFNISSSKNFYLQSQVDFKLKIKETLQTYNFSLQSVVNLRKGKSLITTPYQYYFYSQPYLIRSVIGNLSWFAFTINSEALFKLSLIENFIPKQFSLVSNPTYLRREKRLEVQTYRFNISSNVHTTARHIFRITDQQLSLTITSIRTLPIPPELTCWFLPQPSRFISFYEIYGVYVPLLRHYFSDASYRIFRESTKDYIYPGNLRIELWPGEVTLTEGNIPAIYIHRSELKEQKPGIGTKLSKTTIGEFDKHTNLLHIQGAVRIFIYNYEYYATIVLAAEIQKYLQYIRRIISKRLGFAVLMAPEIINISPVQQVASDNIFVATIEQKVILTLSFKTV
jgi:hypothetical protein